MTAAQSWLTSLSFLQKISNQIELAVIIIHCLAHEVSRNQTDEKEVDYVHDFVILKNNKSFIRPSINLSKAGQMVIII